VKAYTNPYQSSPSQAQEDVRLLWGDVVTLHSDLDVGAGDCTTLKHALEDILDDSGRLVTVDRTSAVNAFDGPLKRDYVAIRCFRGEFDHVLETRVDHRISGVPVYCDVPTVSVDGNWFWGDVDIGNLTSDCFSENYPIVNIPGQRRSPESLIR